MLIAIIFCESVTYVKIFKNIFLEKKSTFFLTNKMCTFNYKPYNFTFIISCLPILPFGEFDTFLTLYFDN